MEDGEIEGRKGREEREKQFGAIIHGPRTEERDATRHKASERREEEVNFEANSSTIVSSAAQLVLRPKRERERERGRGDGMISMIFSQSVGRPRNEMSREQARSKKGQSSFGGRSRNRSALKGAVFLQWR